MDTCQIINKFQYLTKHIKDALVTYIEKCEGARERGETKNKTLDEFVKTYCEERSSEGAAQTAVE